MCVCFGSPLGKYRESCCSHPGVSVHVGDCVCISIVQMSKVFGFSFYKSITLEHVMDQVDNLNFGRYWHEVLCCTITTHMGDLRT